MRDRHILIIVGFTALALGAARRAVEAQSSLSPVAPSGQTATPVFEGWYRNSDGSFSLSFGYYNRNASEILSVAVGPDNFMSPGDSSQGQPTQFYPRRQWGAFAVRVPADFGTKTVVWTLRTRGRTFAIPGGLKRDWEIDALEGEAGSGNTPPGVSLDPGGAEARGPAGRVAAPRSARVGQPIMIDALVKDDGLRVGTARAGAPVELEWFTHQGPALAAFGAPKAKLTPTGGSAATSVTFSEPGSYVLRVRASDAPLAVSGHAQCCWTNAFVNVRVTP